MTHPTAPLAMSALPELLVLCNPLLDVQATVQPEYLNKYDLKSNDAILIEDATTDPRMKIFDELADFPDVKYIAGGAGQNSARGAAYILGPGKVAYFGCVGNDKFSEKLLNENEKAGVTSLYQVVPEIGTGKCAALINGHNRSLVTDLGAANHFKPEHIDKHWDAVTNSKLFYIGGFHLTVSPEAIIKLGKHAKEIGKPFILNFSAPFIPQFFKTALTQVIPYATHIIANETEAAAYAEAFGLTCDTNDLEAIAKTIIETDPTKTVIFTHGLEPTVVVTKDGSKMYSVKPLDQSKIVDTNGAGDAFAAGFIAGLVQGKTLDVAVDMGQWLASLSIQEVGPSYPVEKFQYQ